jgi:hypothetical protein
MLIAALLFTEDQQFFMMLVTLVGAAFLAWKLLGPLAQALARRLEGRPGSGAQLDHDLADLRSRVHELEAQQGRVMELEERLDFAERLLARQRPEPGRVAMGGDQ